MSRSSLLLVSDLNYRAQGRSYGDEDTWLAGRLRERFDVAICSPLDATALMAPFDLILVRNSGPVIHYQEEYDTFRRAAIETGARLVNPPTGQGDQQGKGYLVTMCAGGEAVIPTVGRRADLPRLPNVAEYVVKPVLGADSVGLRFFQAEQLPEVDLTGCLVQPRMDVVHEISFVFVGRSFSYATYAPDHERRWELVPYPASDDEIAFAQRFVDWNSLEIGVQRVDACRTRDGDLLLVELEDLNPYLSLDVLEPSVRESFCAELVRTLETALQLD
jgi:hypothetical protein